MGTRGWLTSQGALAHELEEGVMIAANGDVGAAHNYGLAVEGKVNGVKSGIHYSDQIGSAQFGSTKIVANGVARTAQINFQMGNVTNVLNNKE